MLHVRFLLCRIVCLIFCESKSVRNLQICAMFIRQLKLMILINCVQSEHCANFVDCVFCAHVRNNGNALSLFFIIFSGLAPMREKMVAAHVSVRQTPA